MREIESQKIKEAVARGAIEACRDLPPEVERALKEALSKEDLPLARRALEILLENVKTARKVGLPLCQDTGIPVVFVRIGEDVQVKNLYEAIEEGLYLGFKEGYLRASVCEVLSRRNTGTNTPGVIHCEIVPGEELEIFLLPKGCGSENMSRLAMLPPSAGLEGIKNFVIETVSRAGANPCPPVVVGVGIGGNFETAALLSKKALLRPLAKPHPEKEVADLEEELLLKINQLGIGPLGLGGQTTALAVHIETHPSHIASLPVAVNIQCHAHRIKRIVL
ncbi:fumarate hydratase [Thermosulfurimonas dismutans]|uniref:Fumarate hydratase class I, aerobic n=1 Tax=Thermosulfurimonas dismutans TaxID=999894 RepID=A0A179D245_9BACT|nr:fumarate hydratase [Thermosulfurimonas dismutans]OAQ20144.1 Fumarate hydratase class I, aerobic [Thermosulfurimonas dismutans]